MKAICRRLVLAGLGAALGGCAARPAPPVQRYALGMARAEYRDYGAAKANPCDSEPRWLSDELTTVNGLLARFLRETEKATQLEAVDQARHLELLQEAARTLPPVLEVHQRNLAGLRECGFRGTGAFPEIARRGGELLEASRARLEEAPRALAAAALREARKQWKEEAPQKDASARATWCPANPQLGQADLYYARQEQDGRIEWRFCDGHVVEQRAGGAPNLLEPDGLTRYARRRIQPQRYLDAARNYPAEEIDRPPTGASVRGATATPPARKAGGQG